MGKRVYTDIEYQGRVFATAQDLAAHVGRSPQTVMGAIRSGRLDQLGVGRGRGSVMPVRIAGRDFSCARDAAAAFGVSRKAVYMAISAGDPDRLARRRKAVNAKAITIGPLTFASRAQASVELGFSKSYVSQALRLKSAGMWQNILAAAMRLAAERDRRVA